MSETFIRPDPQPAEREILQAAKKLAVSYRRKLTHLEAFVAELEGKNVEAPESVPKNRYVMPKMVMPQTAETWVRYAIQQMPRTFMKSDVAELIMHTDEQAFIEKFKGTRFATVIWKLTKDGEIAVVEHKDGQQPVYSITIKFQPWLKFRRVTIKRKGADRQNKLPQPRMNETGEGKTSVAEATSSNDSWADSKPTEQASRHQH